ncbi:unnamed protein product [Hymenolepis diminuta]|uniref:GRAM domain-containing protein n=1 Tax=Hymenolepis diminuta TaxID=6216 RepID=A0A564YU04_HYMDI|nr:unnamed protein product [Hymenolepis diminuta]
MSINTAQSQDGLGVVLYYGERLLVTYEGCKLTLTGSGNQPNGKLGGSAYLTSHRVIFLTKEEISTIKSLSMPFVFMKRVEIKQPTFGANYIEGFVRSETGQWEGEVHFKMVFNHGGAIEFGKALLELGTRASSLRKTYQMPPVPPACEIYSCPPPAYTPFVNDPYYNSFMQPHPSFSPAPSDYLYQTNAPPPYPGAVPPPYSAASAAPPPYTASESTPSFSGPQISNFAPYPVPPPNPAPYPTGYPQGPSYTPYTAANPQNATTGYYYPQDPNTFYAPLLNQASAPPMESEDKKNK